MDWLGGCRPAAVTETQNIMASITQKLMSYFSNSPEGSGSRQYKLAGIQHAKHGFHVCFSQQERGKHLKGVFLDLQTSLQHVVLWLKLGHSWLEGSGRECSLQHKGGCMSTQNLEPPEKTIESSLYSIKSCDS